MPWQQRTQGVAWVGGAHEGFADEEGVKAGVAEAGDVGGGFDAAFGDLDDVGRDAVDELERGIEVNVEGMEVAVVDPDEVASGGEGAVEFGGVVDFAEDVELEFAGAAMERDELVLFEGGDDEQDGVGAAGAGLEELEVVEDEVFAEAGDGDGLGGKLQISQRALEEGLVGEDGERGGAGGFEFGGERGDVEVGADEAFGGRGFLELGDDGGAGLGDSAQVFAEAAGVMALGCGRHFAETGRGFVGSDTGAGGGQDFFQLGGHG